MTILVAGRIRVDPADRDEYVASCREVVEAARQTAGFLDFAITADTIEPDRVNIFENWESREALDIFRGEGPSDEQTAQIREVRVAEHETVSSRTL